MASDPPAEAEEMLLQSHNHYLSYLLTGNFDDLQEAVRCTQEILDGTPPDAPQMTIIQCTLARQLARRFLHTRQEEDLKNAKCMFLKWLPHLRRESWSRQKFIRYLFFCELLLQNKLGGSIELDDLHALLRPTFTGEVKLPVFNEAITFSVDRDKVYDGRSSELLTLKIDTLRPAILGEDEEVFEYFLRKRHEDKSPPEASLKDLDSEIQLHRRALKTFSSHPSDCRKVMIILMRLALLLDQLHSLQNIPEQIGEAVDCFCIALELPMRTHSFAECFSFARIDFVSRFEELERSEDLNNAVNNAKVVMANGEHVAEEVFNMKLPDAPQVAVAVILHTLARQLVRRYLHNGEMEDILNAVGMFAHALGLLTDDSSARQICFNYLWFSCLLRDKNLARAIELSDLFAYLPSIYKVIVKGSALTSTPGEHEKVFEYFVTDLNDFNKCVPLSSQFGRKIDTLAPKSAKDEEVFDDFMRKGPGDELPLEASCEELDSEIQRHRRALKVFSPPPSDPHKILTISMRLGVLSSRRYGLQNKREDIDVAISSFCQALKLPMRTDTFSFCLFLASTAFISRFEALGKRDDLDHAVNYAKQATANLDPQDEDFPRRWDLLARVMINRYSATGDVKDLDAAVEASLRAVSTPEHKDFHNNAQALTNLATGLRCRFEITGQIRDLRGAVEYSQRAMNSLPREDPRWVRHVVNLSRLEFLLGDRTWEMEYVAWGIVHAIKANAEGAQHLESNTAFAFEARMTIIQFCIHTGRREEAIMALRVVNQDFTHIRGVGESYRKLCELLLKKWMDTHEDEVFVEATQVVCRSIELEHLKPNELIQARKLLGMCWHHRYKFTRDNEDLKNAQENFLKGFEMSAGAPIHRIMAGLGLIDTLCDQGDWNSARKASQRIINLIVIASSRSLDCTDKQFLFQKFLFQIPTYASIALQGKEAGSDVFDVIDMLETCRGSILGHMIDYRIDLDDLRAMAPAEADLFTTLGDEINREINCRGIMNDGVEQIARRSRVEEFDACLEKIRKVKGFDRFLLGPSRNELMAAAAQGPILIVIITPVRSDAIIVAENGLAHLSLPEFKYEEVAKFQETGPTRFKGPRDQGKKNRSYLRFLQLLWEKCVKLIFHKLDELLPGVAKFHVWWLGIGIASSLPFHAAGIYTKKVPEGAPFRAISSYTPSLKFLMHGRRRIKHSSPNADVQCLPSKPDMLIVTMPSTPAYWERFPSTLDGLPWRLEQGLERKPGDLKGVLDETEKIKKAVEGFYSAKHSIQPSAKQTLRRMEKCQIVHFACHGKSSSHDPLSSHLLLQTTSPDSATAMLDKLTMRDVIALNLSHGKLAFLSACSTAESRDNELWDEALHLAAGFQVAGCLHSVGNLWPADDDVSVQIVEGFYQHLTKAGELGNGEYVARALNEALIDVLKEEAGQPLAWASFVHFGI